MDTSTNISSTVANPVAPEDLSAGCYIAVFHVINEHMPFMCDQEFFKGRTEPAKIRWLPGPACPPMKVIDVCLPFVLVRRPDGKVCTLDVRRHRLARLSDSYGRKAFRALKAADKAKNSKLADEKDGKDPKAGEREDDKKE